MKGFKKNLQNNIRKNYICLLKYREWPSGLRRTLESVLTPKVLRGFESLPLCILILFIFYEKITFSNTSFFLLFSLSNCFYSQLLLNEISVHKGLYDEFQEENDWIEIINSGSNTVNLNNYFMSDDINNLQKWRFPNYQLASNEKNSNFCIK